MFDMFDDPIWGYCWWNSSVTSRERGVHKLVYKSINYSYIFIPMYTPNEPKRQANDLRQLRYHKKIAATIWRKKNIMVNMVFNHHVPYIFLWFSIIFLCFSHAFPMPRHCDKAVALRAQLGHEPELHAGPEFGRRWPWLTKTWGNFMMKFLMKSDLK